jgi:hypothetical protein
MNGEYRDIPNSECCICRSDEIQGLVYDEEKNLWAHLSCINNNLLDPEHKLAQSLSHLLEMVDEGDYDA